MIVSSRHKSHEIYLIVMAKEERRKKNAHIDVDEDVDTSYWNTTKHGNLRIIVADEGNKETKRAGRGDGIQNTENKDGNNEKKKNNNKKNTEIYNTVSNKNRRMHEDTEPLLLCHLFRQWKHVNLIFAHGYAHFSPEARKSRLVHIYIYIYADEMRMAPAAGTTSKCVASGRCLFTIAPCVRTRISSSIFFFFFFRLSPLFLPLPFYYVLKMYYVFMHHQQSHSSRMASRARSHSHQHQPKPFFFNSWSNL